MAAVAAVAKQLERQVAGRISTEFAGRPGRSGFARCVGVYEAHGFDVQACISFIAFPVGNGQDRSMDRLAPFHAPLVIVRSRCVLV